MLKIQKMLPFKAEINEKVEMFFDRINMLLSMWSIDVSKMKCILERLKWFLLNTTNTFCLGVQIKIPVN